MTWAGFRDNTGAVIASMPFPSDWSDKMQERTNAVDPSTGQKYKVAAGANNYWMNSDGEYISTDKQGYNPNLDDNMNSQRWQELQEVR